VVLPIRMQGYRGAVQAFVLESILEGFDVVLGDAWMRQHSVTLNYCARRMELRKGKRHLSLAPSDLTAQASGAKEHRLVSIAAIRRALRKGDEAQHAFLVVVTAAGGNTTMQAPANGLGEAGVRMAQTSLDSILQEYADVMPDDLPAGLPPERGVGHIILLLADNLKPPNRPLYRLSPLEMEEAKRQVADLLAKGFIEPSTSNYGASIWFVKKKDGSLRKCVDWRALNAQTKRNQYPLPRMDSLIAGLGGAKVFSALDLQSGYHQIGMSEEDRPKTAFKTPMGLYQFKVLGFGLTNAPATFQAVMNSVFRDIIGKYVVVYLGDVLVFSHDAQEHAQHLEERFEGCERLGYT
jgi:hypothetical protein